MKTHKHPQYSVPYPIAVMDENQVGVVIGLGDLTGFTKAAMQEEGIQKNIRIDSALYMQNDIHEGGKYRFGDGTQTAPSIAFKGSPGTGLRRPAANVIAQSIAGVEKERLDATRVTFQGDIRFKSGTNFAGDFEHNNSADRTYTWPNSSGTVALVPVTNADLADMAAWTTKIRNAGTTGDPSDAAAADLTTEAAPAAGDYVWIWTDEGAGVFQIKKVNWSSLPGGGATPHALMDGIIANDTVAQTPSKGSIIAGKTTPSALWDELVVGTDTHVLTADSAQTLGVKWAVIPTQTSTLLDGSVHTDTVAQTVSRGSIIYANATPKWDELPVGGSGRVLTSDGTDVAWTAPATQTSPLLDGAVHTDTAASTVARGDIIVANSTPKWSKLAIGSSTNPKKVVTSDGTDATWVRNQGSAVHVPTTGDTAINSVTDVTIVTKDVTEVSAGDQIVVEGEFTILNNSGATRAYIITIDFDAAFDIEFTTGALATSATLIHPFSFRAVCDLRSSSLAYCVSKIYGQLAAGIASGTDTTMLATNLHACGWGTSASNLLTTTTVALFIRSPSATATQTCRLHHFSIRKYTPF